MSDLKQAEIGSIKGSFISSQPCTEIHTRFRAQLVEILKSQEEILPPAQSSLGKLIALFQSPESSVEDCVEIIKLDPALTARIFRLANSPTYRGRATSISEAVIHLGFAQVRQIAFSVGFFKRFAEWKLPPGLEHFWLRNLFVARLLERLAARHSLVGGTEYLAGLLHDTGWLLLATHFPEELELIAASEHPSPLSDKEILSFTHAEIAGAFCARSLLPPRVMTAVVSHHNPLSLLVEGLPPRQDTPVFLAVLICICDKLADACNLQIPWQKTGSTMDEIKTGPEVVWLAQFGARIDYDKLIEDELPKAQELASALATA